jgi:hypothetical protein
MLFSSKNVDEISGPEGGAYEMTIFWDAAP